MSKAYNSDWLQQMGDLLDGLNDIVLVVNPVNGALHYWNQAARLFFAGSADSPEHPDVKSLFADSQPLLGHINGLEASQVKSLRVTAIASKGSTDVVVVAKPISLLGEKAVRILVEPLVHANFQPDTDNLKVFEVFFKNNTLPLILVDFDSLLILNVNRITLEFFNTPLSEIVGKPLSLFSELPAAEFNRTLSSFVTNSYSGFEIAFRTSQNQMREVELHYTLARFTGQNLLLCALVDISMRNQAFGELHNIKNNLAQEVARQTKDLIRINNSLLEQIRFRRETENELRQSHKLFMLLFQMNPNGLVLKDNATQKVVDVNQNFLNTFRFKSPDVIGKSVSEMGIICNTQEYDQIQEKIKVQGSANQVPLTLNTSQGHVLFTLYSGGIIKFETKEYMLEVYQDITQQQIVQQKLAENEEKYRTMFSNAIVGIVRTDATTGAITSCNEQFAKMLGYKTERDILGKSFERFFKDDGARTKFADDLRSKGTAVHEFELLTRSGKSIWVVDHATINLKERYIDKVIIDITDRKLMESLLTQNENRFRSMIEKASGLILVVSQEGDIKYLSPSVQAELGYEIEYYAGIKLFDFIHPSECDKLAEQLKHGSFSPADTFEISVRHKNGYYRTYEYSATDMSHNPAVDGIIINARDITEQIRAREEISATLLREQELSRQKTQFISTVSHEFRTPLTNISLNIQLLTKYVKEGKSVRIQNSLDRMVNAEKRLTALLNEVSLVSKDQSGRLRFSPESWDINILIDSLLDQLSYLMQPMVRVNRISFKPEQAMLDKTLLLHIMANLLGNAIKYSPPTKEITLTIEVDPGSKLIVKVRDQGIGVPESELPFLYDPYFRASNSKHISGTGLGLSIAKRCVELHGGSLECNTKEGVGTEFICSIPLKKS